MMKGRAVGGAATVLLAAIFALVSASAYATAEPSSAASSAKKGVKKHSACKDSRKGRSRTRAKCARGLAIKSKLRSGATELLPVDVREVAGNPDGTLRIVLRKGAVRPKVGKPLIVPVSKIAPDGVLGAVTAINRSRGGRLIVVTRPATLDEAYSQLRIEIEDATLGELSETSTASASARQLFDCTGSGPAPKFDVDSDFSKLKPQFTLDIRRPEIFFLLSGTATLNLDVSSKTSVSCKYSGDVKFRIPIAGTPVVVTVEPAINGSLSGAMGAGFSWSPRMAVGVQKGPSVNQSFHTFDKGAVTSPSFQGSAQAKMFLGVSVGVSVAERVGVEGTAGPQLKAGVSAQNGSVCLDADASLRADLNAYADVFVKRWSFSIAKGEFGRRQLFHTCNDGGRTGGSSGGGAGAPSKFIALTAGQVHSCGLTTEHTIRCWGGYQAWDGPPAGPFAEVSAGHFHTCARRVDGTVLCWGSNNKGQTDAPDAAFKQISGGFWHTCGVQIDGAARCWGDNEYGQSSPPPGAFRRISAGADQTCGLRLDGTAVCWGGDDPPDPPAVEFDELSLDGTACGRQMTGEALCWGYTLLGYAEPPPGPFKQVETRGGFACGIHVDGRAECWGESTTGVLSPPAGSFSQIAVGAGHVCGLRGDGSAVCWGTNHYGQASPPS